jgi:hypothetical protein
MGTNYYWRTEPCEHCGRSDEVLHICKSLNKFRGHFTWPDDGGDAEPWVVSWQDWKAELRGGAGRIFDEYGAEHDVEEFIRCVELVPMESRRRQFDWMVENRGTAAEVAPGCDWLDADGFSFIGGEFS